MSRSHHIRLMATYNATMNERVFEAAARLPPEELAADRKAFFGSILGTLNHIANADVIWLKRFAQHPAAWPQLDPVRALPDPISLRAIAFADLDSLWALRRMLDQVILDWAAAMTEDGFDHTLHYVNSRGTANKNYFSLVMHFFNHQTHHRGQVSTLLSQQGVDIGVTDLLFMIPDEA